MRLRLRWWVGRWVNSWFHHPCPVWITQGRSCFANGETRQLKADGTITAPLVPLPAFDPVPRTTARPVWALQASNSRWCRPCGPPHPFRPRHETSVSREACSGATQRMGSTGKPPARLCRILRSRECGIGLDPSVITSRYYSHRVVSQLHICACILAPLDGCLLGAPSLVSMRSHGSPGLMQAF